MIRPDPLPAAGGGLPTPSWLGRGKTVSGHIAGIDPDRILLRSLDWGEVLFFVDSKTVVRVEKTPLALADLQEGDPVAVKLKEIKGKGPYAVEILPHPEVRRRKERGGASDKPIATPLPESPEPAVSNAGAAAEPQEVPVPALPSSQRGIRGTITEMKGDEATVQTTGGDTRKVLVTAVTRIVKPKTEEPLTAVVAGDKVAITGDELDNGVFIAREIWVNRSREVAAAAQKALVPAKLSGDFSGVITAIEGEEMRVKTADGVERKVLVLPSAGVQRWGTTVPFSAVRVGDQVQVSGDVLEDGTTVAREVVVSKPASGRN